MERLLANLRYAFRSLCKDPSFVIPAVLTLGLGIGINTTVFSVVNAILIRPMPHINSERLVVLRDVQNSRRSAGAVSYPDFADWKAQSRALQDIGAYHDRDVVMIRPGSDAEQIQAEAISTNLFQMLGARPAMGRLFLSHEDGPGRDRVVILSDKLWTERFGARADAVGSTVIIDGQPHTVVGVMPPRFGFPDNQVMWLPLSNTAAGVARGSRYLRVLGKLKPNTSIVAARQDLNTVAARLTRLYPESDAGHTVRVLDFNEVQGGGFRPVLLLMLGAVGLVLLIACSNVASIFLTRGLGRQLEVTVRMALGAHRSQVVSQLLTESIIVALAGGVAGVGVAYVGLRVILSALPFEPPLWMVFDIDGNVLLFTFAISVMTGAVFGLAPALGADWSNLAGRLRAGRRGVLLNRTQGRMHDALVVLELAFAAVLLVGATAMVRSLLLLQRVDPGFSTASVITAQIPAAGARYDDEAARKRLFTTLVQDASVLRGVTSAAVVTHLPLTGGTALAHFEIEGHPGTTDELPSGDYRGISADYFQTIGMPIDGGRSITTAEVEAAAPVIVVNRTFARVFWPNVDPVGKRIRIGERWLTVVGIVRDARIANLDEPPNPQVYAPFTLRPPQTVTLLLHTSSVAATAPEVRKLVRATDPGIALGEIVGLDEVVHRSLWKQRLFGGMFAAFAFIALVLAVTGVYSVMLRRISQRTHEFGVRMALGADTGRILRLVLGQAGWITALGLVVGTLGGLLLVRVMASMLYGIGTVDPPALAGSIAVLGAASLLAAYLPARRATLVDPTVALRLDE
ncbi:MAG: ABC transporter permease [Gemmatimonadaceae bacterium]